jgi:hypothetical protein
MAAIDDIRSEEEMPEVGSSPGVARADSILDHAKKKRAERENHLFLDVPSWDGDMVAEYRVLSGKEIDQIAEQAARRMKSKTGDPLQSDLDLIARANLGLYMVDPESGDRVPLEDDYGVVGYSRVAAKLGMEEELDSNAKVIKYLTGERKEDGSGWQENQTAVTMHANSIARWMRDPSKNNRTLEEILGEL